MAIKNYGIYLYLTKICNETNSCKKIYEYLLNLLLEINNDGIRTMLIQYFRTLELGKDEVTYLKSIIEKPQIVVDKIDFENLSEQEKIENANIFLQLSKHNNCFTDEFRTIYIGEFNTKFASFTNQTAQKPINEEELMKVIPQTTDRKNCEIIKNVLDKLLGFYTNRSIIIK